MALVAREMTSLRKLINNKSNVIMGKIIYTWKQKSKYRYLLMNKLNLNPKYRSLYKYKEKCKN